MSDNAAASSSLPSVGVIGLGIMGSCYARHLLEASFSVTGYDVSAERMASFGQAGGQLASSPGEVVQKSDVIVTALSSVAAFRSVMLGADAATAHVRKGQLFIETGTLAIPLKEEARARVEANGAGMVDATVTGTRVHAERRELVVYASGTEADVAAARPVIEAFAHDVRFVGPFGDGMKLKMVTNHLVAVHNVATAEALSLARAAGLDLQLVYDLISSGPATSGVFNFRGPLMVAGRYDAPTMRMDVFEKDIDVIDDFARGLHAATPLFQASSLVYRAALAQGIRAEDVSAVFEILSVLSGHNARADGTAAQAPAGTGPRPRPR